MDFPEDFDFQTKEVSVTEFRRRPRTVYGYIDTLGHVVFFTRRGKRLCAIMSLETYAWMTGDYEKAMTEYQAAKEAYDLEKAKEKGNEDNIHR